MVKLSLVALSLLLSACSTIEKWQIESKEKRTFAVRKAWVRTGTNGDLIKERKLNRMTAIPFENVIIQGNGHDGIKAFDKDSGYEVWSLSVPNGIEAGAVIINERLFFGASDGQFYSVNARTGDVLWTFPTRIENLSEPILEEGIVYFMSGSNTVYALDASSGKQLWLYSRQDPSALSIRGGSKPALKAGTLYVGFSDGSLVALLAKTGTVKWEKQLNKNKKFRDLDTSPVVEGEYLYLMGFDDAIYCLRSATGELVWRFDKGGYGKILLVGDKLFYPSSTEEFIALEKSTGKKIWSYSLKEGIATSGVYYKGLITFGESQGALLFLDANTGKVVNKFYPGRGILSTPMIDEKNNRIYFISGEANVYAMEAKWTYPKHINYLE